MVQIRISYHTEKGSHTWMRPIWQSYNTNFYLKEIFQSPFFPSLARFIFEKVTREKLQPLLLALQRNQCSHSHLVLVRWPVESTSVKNTKLRKNPSQRTWDLDPLWRSQHSNFVQLINLLVGNWLTIKCNHSIAQD